MHKSFNHPHCRRRRQNSNSSINSNNMAQAPHFCKTILLLILIFMIPPLAVFFVQKECNSTVVLNLILYLFLWIPGIIHALYVIYFS
jgi:uncharacterized membrane protein YqaE (UPF0057 family)